MELNLLPYPKNIKLYSGTNFKMNRSQINIYNSTNCSFDMQYVENLLFDGTRINYNYVSSKNEAQLIFEELSTEQMCRKLKLDKQNDKIILQQAYLLEINQNNIICSASTKKGILNSVHTLYQIIKQSAGDIPGLFIKDYPLIPYRGIMLDISRGKIPTVDTLKELVDFIAQYKINVLQLYMEDSFYFISNPEIGRRTGRLTGKEIEEIDIHCNQRGVELQPNLQTFSHFHNILRHPDYHHLSENNTYWTLAPGKEESYLLLDNMLKNLIDHFSSKTININMDEAYDIGTDYSRTKAEKYGKEKVYLDHLLKTRKIVKKYGIEKIFIWGDMINKHPEMLEKLPEDITVIDWHYEPSEEYSTLANYENYKHRLWAAAGTSSWNSIFPRIKNAKINISNLSYSLYKLGGEGFLVTDWGDYGHYQPLGMSFYPYILSAEASWNCNHGVPDYFENSVKKLLFKNNIQYNVWSLLVKSSSLVNTSDVFKSKTIYAFFDDILKGRSLEKDNFEYISKKQFQCLFDLGYQAYNESCNLDGNIFDKELKLLAWMTYFTGKKGVLSWEIKNSFACGDVNKKNIFKYIIQIKDLYQELERIRQLFSEVWDLRSHYPGKEITMFYFSKAAVQLSKAVIWLNNQSELINENIDSKLESYKGADNYTTLWTQDFKNMWDKSYPWS